MMLNMSNKFSNYQNMASGSVASMSDSSLSMLAAPHNFSQDSSSSIASNSGCKGERESIHSGQFMVSTFEAEEAQDDLDDSEIKMLDPEDPTLSKAGETNTCTDVQLYVPRNVAQQNRYGSHDTMGSLTSHLEIETSLTKLFNCMNLAYSQKLTSPKWNHFKGVRLRWKDKIRLNNVIWRCWHMQFILKRRTPVCQFASPLDVDIHSNPQSVVLEGKYWKRQVTVIKAEYRKWRRNYKSNVSGSLIYDTKSEFDFLEWSPLNDKSLMLADDWTSDTLFSAINVPFPFPDSREIARGAGIADFIQPSLGPLQPNLDDIDLTFAELLQSSRLPPVPEEGSDDMIKNVDYTFSAIMGSDQMESSNIMEVASTGPLVGMQSTSDDTNMMDLNTPLNSLQYSELEQHFATRNAANVQMLSANSRETHSQMQSLSAEDTIMGEPQGAGALLMGQASRVQHSQQMKPFHSPVPAGVVGMDNSNAASGGNNNMMGRQSTSGSNDFPVKKGRISKNSQRPFRREPHNYDKAQPTLHQTNIYQRMLAEQQKAQQMQHLQQPSMSANNLQHQTTIYHSSNQPQSQQQQQQQNPQHQTFLQSTPQYATNLLNASTNFASSESLAGAMVAGPLTSSINVNNGAGFALMNAGGSSQANNSSIHNIKIEVPSSDVLTMFNLSQSSDGFASANQYKPYSHPANFKKSSSTGTYINVRGAQASAGNQLYMSSTEPTPATMHAQSLPLSVGMHLTGLVNTLPQQQPHQSVQLQLQPRTAQMSPPNMQHQQQQQQQSSQLGILGMPQVNMNQQQQSLAPTSLQSLLSPRQLVPQQQQQQQQQLQHQTQQLSQAIQTQAQSSNPLPKEIYRSNSLPLNVSLQKLDQRLAGHDNFVIPKNHVTKTGKARSRSNSIHQHMVPSANTAPSSNVLKSSGSYLTTGGAGVNAQLQAATSDPMLNSTLAQLLTTNSRMSALGKQQSVSTSAISAAPNVAMATLQLPAPASVQNKLPTRTATAGVFVASPQPQVQQSLSSPASPSMAGAGATASSSPLVQQQQLPLSNKQLMLSPQQPAAHSKSPKKSASLPTPVAPSMLSSPPTSKMLSFPLAGSAQTSCSTNLSISPESFHDQDSPLSPSQSAKYPRDSQRRVGHIHAEQKRRYNIKNGFDQLHDLIPQLQQNNAKLSKAAMLQKGAEHIKHLRNERSILKERMETLRMERDALNNSLTHLHSILPANGAPVTRQGTEHVRQLYEQYVRSRTQDNWKFWILGLILEPLLTSYTSTVSSASLDELRRTAFLWVDQHCSLIDLRPAVSNKLKYLSMKTDILSEPPSTLQEEVAKAVHNSSGKHPNLHGT